MRWRSGLQHDLGAVVVLVLEHLISRWRVVEREVVRDDEAGVDLAGLDPLEQPAQYPCTWDWPRMSRSPWNFATAIP